MKLRIEKMVYGGDGLAREAEGAAVFVPFTLPGELVETLASSLRDGRGKAQLLALDEASPERVAARCRHFGRCGGCQYQHASYSSQLTIKTDILSETLERAGIRNRPPIAVHAAPEWAYRNRIRLRVEVVEGAIRVGYNLRETREILPISECPISAPVLWRAAEALIELGAREPDCAQWMRAVAEIELFASGDERQLQMTVFLRKGRSAGFAEFCEALRTLVPELVGAGAEMFSTAAAPSSKGARRPAAEVSWGKGGLAYAAASRSYWVSRGGFFQVNRFLVDELVRVVTGERSGVVAWDLFSGVGLFSRVLAESFERVVAVEANAVAIRDLAAAKIANLRGVAASAVEFVRGAAVERERPDVVVMDPPRAGVGAEVCGLLARLEVPEVVYVSCDPTTLARDLRVMVDSGYDLAELHLVDLFPQTFHLETVAILRRLRR